MTQFDRLLRQGLMDANLNQYESTLRQAGSMESDFSPRYLRERMRLLADPWRWMRRRAGPVPRRGILRGAAAAAAVLLIITAAAAVSVSLWFAFFGGLDQRQQEIVDNMEIDGGEAKETAAERLLPPPAEHDGVTVTPLSLLGAKNQFYMALEIRAPEGTVFRQDDTYHLFISHKRPQNAPMEVIGFTEGFTVVEAGTKEPNVLTGVLEETSSVDLGGWTFCMISLTRFTADGESELIFEASPETGTWDLPIPEELNKDQVLEPQVEGVSMTTDRGTMTLLSLSVSPLGIWWKYSFDGNDPWPRTRMALRMQDGSVIEAAPGQMTMGDMGSGQTTAITFEKPVDLSHAAAAIWGDVEIPLEQPAEAVAD